MVDRAWPSLAEPSGWCRRGADWAGAWRCRRQSRQQNERCSGKRKPEGGSKCFVLMILGIQYAFQSRASAVN